jgi:hypothetical protein
VHAAVTPPDEAAVSDLAAWIAGYLNQHPHAADTADGIRHWWLGRHLSSADPDDVTDALEWLVARGVVEKVERPGNAPIYRCATRTDRR